MKRHQQTDRNTAEWYDAFYASEVGHSQTNACRDVFPLLTILTRHCNRVLDVGCGRGAYFPHIRSREVHGVDFSEQTLAKTQREFPSVCLKAADITNGIPYPDNHFDLVYCGELVEHLEKPMDLTREILRVLEPGGVCVLNTPYKDMIPCDVHLWFVEREDLHRLFNGFDNVSVFRFDNSASMDEWDHFLVVASKPESL